MESGVGLAGENLERSLVPQPSSYVIQSPLNVLDKEAKMKDLVCEFTGEWNIDLIGRIYNPAEVSLTFNLPLSKHEEWKGAFRQGSWVIFLEKSIEFKHSRGCQTILLEGIPWYFTNTY